MELVVAKVQTKNNKLTKRKKYKQLIHKQTNKGWQKKSDVGQTDYDHGAIVCNTDLDTTKY